LKGRTYRSWGGGENHEGALCQKQKKATTEWEVKRSQTILKFKEEKKGKPIKKLVAEQRNQKPPETEKTPRGGENGGKGKKERSRGSARGEAYKRTHREVLTTGGMGGKRSFQKSGGGHWSKQRTELLTGKA